MKHLLRQAVLGLVLASMLCGSARAQTQPRIGTIDVSTVFDSYYKKKQAETLLKDRKDELIKELKEIAAKIDKDTDAYNKALASAGDANISPDERDKRKSQAEDMLKKLKQSKEDLASSERSAQETIAGQQSRMVNRLVDDIRDVVSAKARTAGFSLVIDSSAVSAKGTPIVLFNNKETDLTDTVLAQLNAGAPLDTTPPSDAASGKKDDTKKK
jgi:Skp family chaperone for outer membrane proteins